jgi:D-alanine-D-alanine ligase
LGNSGLTIAPSFLVDKSKLNSIEESLEQFGMRFPLVLKPIRGRGSEGVTMVDTLSKLQISANELLQDSKYGDKIIVEQYLSGQEITITVMPIGHYKINEKFTFKKFWALPIVKRFNHINGIAPYNGVVAVVKNSSLLNETELKEEKYLVAMRQCEEAAILVGAKAPIRVDCRESNGKFFLFDLNMKPNMTGSGRPGREDQDSLTCIAARGIGWNFTNLLLNMLRQAWKAEEM